MASLLLGLALAMAFRGLAQDVSSASAQESPAPWSEAASSPFAEVEHVAVGLQLQGGGARIPFFTRAFPSTLGHGLVLRLSGAYRVSDRWLLSAQLPLVLMEIAQPAGSYVDEFSWGNANVALAEREALWRSPRLRLDGVTSVSAGVPSAEWGPKGSLLGLRALQVASAMAGWREQELYTSGTLPISVGYGALLEHSRVGIEASLRAPLFLRLSRARLPPDARARWLALTPVLHIGGRYTPARWIDLTLAADTVFNTWAPVRPVYRRPATQFVLVPAVSFRLRELWRLRADFMLPVAGPLGAKAYAGGFSLGWDS